jgi:DNA-binding transcriptional LysR family regulator
MHLRGLDMNLLVALDALIKDKNISRSGERLHLSQSGMSTALGRLREYFADPLLVRIGRQMVLTPLAESLADPVHDVVLQVQAIIDHTPAFDPARSERNITIMVSDYVATTFLPQLLQRVHAEAPRIVVDLVSQEDHVHGPLARGEIDFLIIPEQFASPDHPSQRLFSDTYVCIAWSENSTIGDHLDLDTYMAAGHVVTRFGETRKPTIESWLVDRFQQQRLVEVSVMNFSTVPFYVIGTQRIATVHARLAKLYSQSMPLRIYPAPFEAPRVVEVVQWHRYSDKHPATVWLRSLMREHGAQFTRSSLPG